MKRLKELPQNSKFCSDCGEVILIKAEICPKCGVRQGITVKKSKTVAVVLAILLGYWTWIYTWKHDSWKFWSGLILCICGIFLLFIPNIVVMIWAIVDTAIKPGEWYENY